MTRVRSSSMPTTTLRRAMVGLVVVAPLLALGAGTASAADNTKPKCNSIGCDGGAAPPQDAVGPPIDVPVVGQPIPPPFTPPTNPVQPVSPPTSQGAGGGGSAPSSAPKPNPPGLTPADCQRIADAAKEFDFYCSLGMAVTCGISSPFAGPFSVPVGVGCVAVTKLECHLIANGIRDNCTASIPQHPVPRLTPAR
jgi:hypothetical protein